MDLRVCVCLFGFFYLDKPSKSQTLSTQDKELDCYFKLCSEKKTPPDAPVVVWFRMMVFVLGADHIKDSPGRCTDKSPLMNLHRVVNSPSRWLFGFS